MPARGYIHVYMCVHLFVVLQVGESVLYYPQLHRKYQQDVQNGQLCAPGTNPFKLGKGGVKSPHSFIHSFRFVCFFFVDVPAVWRGACARVYFHVPVLLLDTNVFLFVCVCPCACVFLCECVLGYASVPSVLCAHYALRNACASAYSVCQNVCPWTIGCLLSTPHVRDPMNTCIPSTHTHPTLQVRQRCQC